LSHHDYGQDVARCFHARKIVVFLIGWMVGWLMVDG
jgi:hypothetical protein